MSDIPTRLLRTTLQGRMEPAAPSGCIDTETLGAWSDGTLSARDRAAAESHASRCARCQALLAAMARTMPPAPPTRWWRPSTLAWVAPLAAAAAAVALWIDVPRPWFESFAPPRVEGPAAAVASAPADRAPASTAARPTISADRLTESKTAELRNSPSPPPPAFERQRAVKAEEPRAAAAAAPPAVRPDQADTVLERDAAATPPEAAPSPSRGEERPLNSAGGALSPPAVTSQPFATAARVMSTEAASALRAQAKSGASAGATEIVSPDASVRWRILPGGSVGRSIDGGTTWQTQSTGVLASFTAGSAPSQTICWLAGPGGIIALSTDGRGWQRVPFPEAIDLASIRAADGMNATVTAVDGRTFTTTDGGKTWRSP